MRFGVWRWIARRVNAASAQLGELIRRFHRGLPARPGERLAQRPRPAQAITRGDLASDGENRRLADMSAPGLALFHVLTKPLTSTWLWFGGPVVNAPSTLLWFGP